MNRLNGVFRPLPLDFLAEHYRVVSLADVLAAQEGVRPLPRWPFLITFDDGWADNRDYALPELRRRGLPAALFVVTEAIRQHDGPGDPAEVLDDIGLKQLARSGVAIGTHGISHEPLTAVDDPEAELRHSWQNLQQIRQPYLRLPRLD